MSLLDRMRTAVQDGSTLKAMSGLGPAAFGPVCGGCGKRRVDLMPDEHRAAAERLAGRPLAELEGACKCTGGESR